MSKMLLLGGAAVAACMLLYVFARWERSNREHWVVFLVLGVVLADAVLFQNESTEAQGLFHPGTGSLQFRLPELLITVAILARLLTRGSPRRVGLPAMLWLATAAWWAVEAVEGLVRHDSTVKLPYEAKAIIYVMGAYALAAGVPLRRYLEGRGFERMLRWTAVGASILLLLTFAGKSYSFKLPLLPLDSFGVIGTDAATLFVVVGVVGFMLELAKDHRNRLNLLCVVPLAVSPFFADQRAVLIMLGAAAAVVVGVGMGSTARQRLRVRAFDVTMALFAGTGLVLAVLLVPAITHGQSVTAPLSSTYQRTVGALNTQDKVESAQDRINKWSISVKDAEQHTLLGQGLGYTFTYFDVGPNQFVTTDISENIGLDLWLHTGLIGLVLFLLALVVSLVNGFTAWRLHPDRMVAVLALALVAVVVGFIAKGQVESIFENYRLATVLGLSLGLLRAAVTSGGGNLGDLRTQQELLHHGAL
ncbi:MAG TPA: hypothetical protein VLZ77_08440 [Acidimicrobiales bacterium]|nr:hypothetical protein [Acidimicrobiales bacterium]